VVASGLHGKNVDLSSESLRTKDPGAMFDFHRKSDLIEIQRTRKALTDTQAKLAQ
jgi:methyl-accepting chemotaxis protein